MVKKRTGYKHGKWVQEPVPHADTKKYVDRGTGKEDTRGIPLVSSFPVPRSTYFFVSACGTGSCTHLPCL